MGEQETGTVRITVIDLQEMRAGKLLALASVEIDIDGIIVLIHGIQATWTDLTGTKIEPPRYRDAAGTWRAAITLPTEVKAPLGEAVIDAMVERGMMRRQFRMS